MSSTTKKNTIITKNTKNVTNKKKQKNKNKTINNTAINNTSTYSKKFKGTSTIPITNIIKYMKSNFVKFNKLKIELDKTDKYPIYLEDCFEFGDNLKSGKRVFSFDSQIKGNKNMPLDKLIAYSFYLKTRSAFMSSDKDAATSTSKYLETLKYQMGKDIRRDNRTINGKEYSSELYYDEKKTNNDVADMFYQTIIDYFYKVNKKIDYNIINKICLLSCQNIFNLITDLVTLKLNDMLTPESNSVFNAVKSADIIIKPKAKSMEFIFDSQLIISRDGEPIDPEYPCGNLLFRFFVDFKSNTFKFMQFKLSYDINKCGPSTESQQNNSGTESSMKLQYAIPAALGIGGIIGTPFLLGAIAIGGNNKITKKKKY